jgi:chemotaxis protein MotB
MSSLHANGGDHRGTMRHESLMPTHHDADQESGWMIGYLDIMTLMVALMVLIFTLSHLGRSDEAEPAAAFTPLAIPLPSEMAQALPVPSEPRSGARPAQPVGHFCRAGCVGSAAAPNSCRAARG